MKPTPERRKYIREYNRTWRAEVKIQVLAHYGPQGRLQCAWPDCGVHDVDMLTLDHIHNDGAEHRKQGIYTNRLYRKLVTDGFPSGYQTLCWNHQWKKELLRRRVQ